MRLLFRDEGLAEAENQGNAAVSAGEWAGERQRRGWEEEGGGCRQAGMQGGRAMAERMQSADKR